MTAIFVFLKYTCLKGKKKSYRTYIITNNYSVATFLPVVEN